MNDYYYGTEPYAADERDENTDRRSWRPMKVTHLVFGLVFLGIAATWLVGNLAGINGPALAVAGPVILIAAGAIGLVASLLNSRQRRREREEALRELRAYTAAANAQGDYRWIEPGVVDENGENR